MAASFQNMGPACCCCRYTLQGNEQRVWSVEFNGDHTVAITYAEPEDPADPRDDEFVLNLRPAATSSYAAGTIAPDWKNKRVYYTYIEIGMSDRDTVVKWWNAKASGSAIGTAVTTLSGFLVDSMACDPDNEHIYFTGHDHPHPLGTGSDWNIDFYRMDYDGSNVTLLDSPQISRQDLAGATGPPGIGSMLVHREQQRLYYVKRQNVTTAAEDENDIGIYYRTFADFVTEVAIYEVPCFSAFIDPEAIRLINCLSFDVANGKIYWCEHYQAGGTTKQSNFKRANLDGSGVELLYASTDPYHINFARYSNKEQKIYHEDFDRITTPPRDGFYRRASDFTEEEQIATSLGDEVNGAPFPSPGSSYLWCGYESTG